MSAKISGLTDLRRKFRTLPVAQKRAIHNALRKNAQELTALQKRLVPVRNSINGGGLKRSIRFGFHDLLRMEISAGDRNKNGVFYARFVEFGTKPGKKGRRISIGGRRNRKQYRTHPGTRAQPYFYPAYRALRRRLKGRLTRSVTKAAKAVGVKR